MKILGHLRETRFDDAGLAINFDLFLDFAQTDDDFEIETVR